MARLNLKDDHGLWLEYRRYGPTWEPADFWRTHRGRSILAWTPVAMSVTTLLALGAWAGLDAARPELNASSQAFADESVNAIAAHWSEDDLLARASSEYDVAQSHTVDSPFETWKALGPATRNDGCIGGVAINPLRIGAVITASYTCELDLKTNHAVAIISLGRKAGVWRIDRFYVTPNPPLPRHQPKGAR